mmetsp:Transcript_2516/g.4531  ORF Transcript_2516/g.4531 Transcript_2516/m.4531 type:complete len:293 (-) Transcript_2516:695-1573(-)
MEIRTRRRDRRWNSIGHCWSTAFGDWRRWSSSRNTRRGCCQRDLRRAVPSESSGCTWRIRWCLRCCWRRCARRRLDRRPMPAPEVPRRGSSRTLVLRLRAFVLRTDGGWRWGATMAPCGYGRWMADRPRIPPLPNNSSRMQMVAVTHRHWENHRWYYWDTRMASPSSTSIGRATAAPSSAPAETAPSACGTPRPSDRTADCPTSCSRRTSTAPLIPSADRPAPPSPRSSFPAPRPNRWWRSTAPRCRCIAGTLRPRPCGPWRPPRRGIISPRPGRTTRPAFGRRIEPRRYVC